MYKISIFLFCVNIKIEKYIIRQIHLKIVYNNKYNIKKWRQKINQYDNDFAMIVLYLYHMKKEQQNIHIKKYV